MSNDNKKLKTDLMLTMVLYDAAAVFYVVLIFWVCVHPHLVGVKMLSTSPWVCASFFPQRGPVLKGDLDLFSSFLDLDSLTVNLEKKSIYFSHEYQCSYLNK